MQRHNRVSCDVCEGTGRETIEGERTMICHNGCTDGFFDAEPQDLVGKRARYAWITGTLEWHGMGLALYPDEHNPVVVGIDPLTVEILP